MARASIGLHFSGGHASSLAVQRSLQIKPVRSILCRIELPRARWIGGIHKVGNPPRLRR